MRLGDSAAFAIFNEFNNFPMTDFSFLSDNDIKSIYQYVKNESEKVTTAVTISPAPTQTDYVSINLYIFFNYFLKFLSALVPS